MEGLKLFTGDFPFGGGKAWGYTKVEEKKDIELVLESLKDISSKFPDTGWIISVEGEPERLVMHDGKVIESK